MEFLKNNKLFSFWYKGKFAWEQDFEVEENENGNTLTRIYTFENNLRITNIATKNEKFGSYEWVNYLECIGDTPTEIISALKDCDAEFPLPHEEEYKYSRTYPDIRQHTIIHAPSGSNAQLYEFHTEVDDYRGERRINHIRVGQERNYASVGARSSDINAPFFEVEKQSFGVIFAIGWTGQWNCRMKRNPDSVLIQTKIEYTNFRLLPGEKIRTSSVVLMPYDCGSVHAHNKWRRLLKENYSAIGGEGKPKFGPLASNMWGGLESDLCIERVKIIDENKLPFEYIWMDAGWYGSTTTPTADEYDRSCHWSKFTGDWHPSEISHPDGLLDFSRAIHESGRKFILWFEPERVVKGMPITEEHPEYFLSLTDEETNLILNLGNDNAWDYIYNETANAIRTMGIDCYRQDFNFRPLEHFRKYDTEDRRGITEIKHIMGLYRFWDTLLEEFPELIIDNCASGGRRIDIETLRRSIPLWRSDAYCYGNYESEIAQTHMQNFGSWMPYSGTNAGSTYHDTYLFRSAYGTALSTCFTFSKHMPFGKNKDELAWLKGCLEEYLSLRPYFSEDIYPLTKPSDDHTTWSATQFDRPEKNDGILLAFRRDASPFTEACFELYSVDKDKTYTFTNIDTGEKSVLCGRSLIENGFTVRLPKKRSSAIFLYTAE